MKKFDKKYSIPHYLYSYHFKFKEWKKCFEMWYSQVGYYGKNIQLIVCNTTSKTGSHRKGYYINSITSPINPGDVAYTGDAVKKLEKEIIKQHKSKS